MLDVRGEVTATTDRTTVRLRGDGSDLQIQVEGSLSAGRRRLAEAARQLGAAGLDAQITDSRGRRLATAGASVSSPLGRLVAGSSAVRPTTRGLVAALRRHVSKGARDV